MGQAGERILLYCCAVYCKASCYRHVLPSMMDVVFPNSEQLWPSALWRKETVLRVQAAVSPMEVPLSPQFSAANLFTL